MAFAGALVNTGSGIFAELTSKNLYFTHHHPAHYFGLNFRWLVHHFYDENFLIFELNMFFETNLCLKFHKNYSIIV